MPTDDWSELWDVFHRALDLPEDQRDAFLEQAADGDSEFKNELEALLAAHYDESNDGISQSIAALRQLDPEAMVGTRIGPYRITQVVGEGGMGVVYAAEQTEPIRRRVALKLIKLGMDSREVIARFESERQALALMTHPNIAHVLDAGATESGRPYFVMEYVPGIPITEYCDRHRLSLHDRIALFVKLCDAVQHAHHKGIIHRDIKPSNVLVTIQDEKPEPKIIDFGVAKALTQRLTGKTLHTRFGRLIGTPNYVSPEQAEMGALDVDTRTDIYSLGVLLHELAVGCRPFDAHTSDEERPRNVLTLLRETDPPRPSTHLAGVSDETARVAELRSMSLERLRRDVSGDLDWIILKALEPDRTRRYPSAEHFGKDLERYFANEPVTARPPSSGYRIRKFVARHKLGVAAGAATAVAILIGVAGLTAGYVQARIAQSEAEIERNNALEISEFLGTLLESASPYVAQGADTSLLVSLLQDAAQRIESEVGDQHELAANLHGTISDTYRALGMYDEAEDHSRMELAHIESSDWGADSQQALSSRAGLALVLWNAGRLAESLEMSQEVLERQNALLGESHPETMSTMNNVGIALKGLGRFEEAESLYEELIERRYQTLGPTHRATLITRNNLANLYRDWGRYDDAEPRMREVVKDSELALGVNDPDTMVFTDSYANILVNLGRLDEAESIHRDVLERMRRVNGDDHPDTLGGIYHLGQLYIAKEDFVNAEQQFRLAYQGVSETLGEDHLYALLSLSWLARSLMMQSRWDEAKPLLERGIELSRQIYPAGHNQTWLLECRLGGTLIELGEPVEARRLLEQCAPELRESLGDDVEVMHEIDDYFTRLQVN